MLDSEERNLIHKDMWRWGMIVWWFMLFSLPAYIAMGYALKGSIEVENVPIPLLRNILFAISIVSAGIAWYLRKYLYRKLLETAKSGDFGHLTDKNIVFRRYFLEVIKPANLVVPIIIAWCGVFFCWLSGRVTEMFIVIMLSVFVMLLTRPSKDEIEELLTTANWTAGQGEESEATLLAHTSEQEFSSWGWVGRVLGIHAIKSPYRRTFYGLWNAFLFCVVLLAGSGAFFTGVDLLHPLLPLDQMDRTEGVLVSRTIRPRGYSTITIRTDDGRKIKFRGIVSESKKKALELTIGEKITVWHQDFFEPWPPSLYNRLQEVRAVTGDVYISYEMSLKGRSRNVIFFKRLLVFLAVCLAIVILSAFVIRQKTRKPE